MILNTFLKIKEYSLTNKQKILLGKNIITCYKAINKDIEIVKVTISENGSKMLVVDYPKEFLQSNYVEKIFKRFVKKRNITKSEFFNLKKVNYARK